MRFRKITGASFFVVLSWFFNSCVSTEVISPESNTDTESELVLQLAAPEKLNTRADEGYKLRYIAKIFQGSNNNQWNAASFIERKEIIDGENSENQIIFKVDPEKDYAIMVFADYIPVEYQPDQQGLYKDYFYDTSQLKRITLRTSPGSDTETVSPDFFNNHNYDAFFGLECFYKSKEEKIVSMTLKRITSQVIFRETSDIRGECALKVNKLGVIKIFDSGIQQIMPPASSEANKELGYISLKQTALLDEDNSDLFFFYTLADQTSRSISVEFSVTNNEEVSDPFTIKDIPVKSNYRTIVKGSYVPEDPSLEEPDNSGDIILNIDSDFSWQQEELEK